MKYETNPNFMHYFFSGNPSKLPPIHFNIKFDAAQNGFALMTPDITSLDQRNEVFEALKRVRSSCILVDL